MAGTNDDLHLQSLADLKDGLAAREFSARELTQALLRRIDRVGADLNAFITVTENEALAQADAADRALAANEAGPLTGLPIVHKDLFCTAGVRTTCGSRILENFVSPYDATVVARLKAAGAVMLGKTNMDEFAMGSSNETSYFGPVKNPWQTDFVAGWLIGRIRRGGRRAARAGGDGHGHRRLHSAACGADRHRWHQADLWPGLALRDGRVCVESRSGRRDYAHGRRCGVDVAGHGRLR